MKAIKITSTNQTMLMSRYSVEDPNDADDMFPIGYWLITHFGDDGDSAYEGVITQELFAAMYTVGATLANGFVEIT